ncbi:MAG: GNAT family N-acetyltransferase [Microlunatus sp.]|nr:GNAT family N-acetyltransferase [Microlunatus sp.]
MPTADVAITDFLEDPHQDQVMDFLVDWVSGSRAAAEQHVADHADGRGTTLTARLGRTIAGLVTVRWTSNNPALADHNIPLVHQLIVVTEYRRQGIATALMDAAEHLAAQRGRTAVGITVGLFDEYGPAQRLYAKRGYLPDGRGACRGRTPLHEGQTVTIDHSLIIWLTKELADVQAARPTARDGANPACS